MSSEGLAAGAILAGLAKALNNARLVAVVIGNTAAALSGAPVTTENVDLLVRDTPRNRRKLMQFARSIDGGAPARISELSKVERIEGAAVPIDISYDRISGGLDFDSIRSRAEEVELDGHTLLVASLADVIRSKRAAGRPKDRAVLPILRQTLAVKKAMSKS